MRKPTVFVASSSESLPIARAIKIQLDHDFQLDIWNEDLFSLNQGTLTNLLNLSVFYDFCIAVFSADDISKIRERDVKSIRDNVIFEYGLFLGRLGPQRTFAVVEKGVELFSDLNGVTQTFFEPRENLTSALGVACSHLRDTINAYSKKEIFSLLPSTSLAIGYYNNFLKHVLEELARQPAINIIEKDKVGDIINEHKVEISNVSITILLPQTLGDLKPLILRKKTSKLKHVTVEGGVRGYPFYVSIEEKQGEVKFFDIPTTLLTSYKTIHSVFDEDFLLKRNHREIIESREIANFELTLRNLIPDEIEHKFIVFDSLPNE